MGSTSQTLRDDTPSGFARRAIRYADTKTGEAFKKLARAFLSSGVFVGHVGREELEQWVEAEGCWYEAPGPSQNTFVARLPDVTVAANEALVFTDEGRFVLESADSDLTFLAQAVYRSAKWGDLQNLKRILSPPTPRERISEPVFVLCGVHSTNYHHWTSEYLPKLRMLELYQHHTGETPRVLIPSAPPTWMTEGLELLGVGADRLLEWDGTPRRFDNILLPFHHPSRPDKFALQRENLEWLRTAMAKGIPGDPPISSSRILLSRERATNRRVVNREELEAELADLGFATVIVEDYSVGEQAAMFRDADVVVAPHGAGLVNMIYSTDVKIVEMMLEDAPRLHFELLAKCLGHEYRCVSADRRYGDLVVSPEMVRSRVMAVGPDTTRPHTRTR